MKICVCVKHVPDSASKITIKGKNQFDESITFILNPYDEHAVEEAVRVKKQVGDSEVVAVSVGKEDAIKTLRSALAMGADRAILIKTNGITTQTSLIILISHEFLIKCTTLLGCQRVLLF